MLIDIGAENLSVSVKAIFRRINYSFLSKDQKIEFNVIQLQNKYWFQQLVSESPSLVQLIKNDRKFKVYLTSRRKMQRVFHNSAARKDFKEMISEINHPQ